MKRTTWRAFWSFGRALDYQSDNLLCVSPALLVESERKTLERENRDFGNQSK